MRCGGFRTVALAGLIALAGGLGGGAAQTERAGGTPAASRSSRAGREEPWTFEGRPARSVVTDHYVTHTTIANPDFLRSLAVVQEGALAHYRQFTPGLRLSARPMECYVFAQRSEWARFTQEKTGDDAA